MKYISGTLYAGFVLLLMGVAGLFLATLLPIPGNIEVKIVKSGSMEPAIATGAIVVVKPQASYEVGDVVTFGEETKGQIPTTHRITAMTGDFSNTFYTTKGDANEEQDAEQVAAREVIGKVVFSAPYAGFILDFARQPMGFTLMIGIPAGIIILDELAKIWGEVRRMSGNKRREDEEDSKMDAILAERRMSAEEEEQEPEGEEVGAHELRQGVALTQESTLALRLGERYELSNVRIRNIDGITPKRV